ncbi:MAG: DUF2827 family protein [Verrucomicrobia bacterium]|nr:DUF2827 family protein [Verrucomicrobiota bacterium]
MKTTPSTIRLALAVRPPEANRSLWHSDDAQLAWFLAQLFANVDGVEVVGLLCAASFDPIDGLPHIPLESGDAGIDAVIEIGDALPEDWRAIFQEGGRCLVALRTGNDLASGAERLFFGKAPGEVPAFRHADAVWIFPGPDETNRDFFEILCGCLVHRVPLLWHPHFLESFLRDLPEQFSPGYKPGDARWRIAVCEENKSIAQNLVVPILIVENAHRKNPRLLEEVHVINTRRINTNPVFVDFLKTLDFVDQGLLQLLNFIPFCELMGRRANCVVSHQFHARPPHFVYEALYGNYPVVHNAPQLSSVGFFYREFDAMGGAEALMEAHRSHDANLEETRMANAGFLASLSPCLAPNIKAYSDSLQEAVEASRRARGSAARPVASPNKRLPRDGNSKAIVVYLDAGNKAAEEFSWLQKTYQLWNLHREYDLVVYHNPAVQPPMCEGLVARQLAPMADEDGFWSDYPFVNSFAMFRQEGEQEWLIDKYDYLLKTDCDVFLTANLRGLEPEQVLLGYGGYMEHPETRDEVVQNLVRIFKKLRISDGGLNHVGASIFGRTRDVLPVISDHLALTRRLLETEWKNGDPGKWPGWYRGVASMYAIHLAVNKNLQARDVRLNALDSFCLDNKITRDVLHIHAWHCVADFSKHKWFAGKYKPRSFSGIPDVAKDYCLCVASRSLEELRKLAAGSHNEKQ